MKTIGERAAEKIRDEAWWRFKPAEIDFITSIIDKEVAADRANAGTLKPQGQASEETDDAALIAEQTKIITRLCLAIDPRFRAQPESIHKANYAKRARHLLEEARAGIIVLRNLLNAIQGLNGGATRAEEILADIEEHLGPQGSAVSASPASTDDASKRK